MEIDPRFWRGRSVFLTGHTGFKGGWMSLWLARLGARVTGYALAPNTDPNLFEAADVGRQIKSVIADVRDGETLAHALRAAEPEVVIHMAAQPLVRYSYANPVETYATNVMGTVNLLEAVRSVPSVRAVVVVTTDKCYENQEWEWGYRETDRLGGHDPYSNSKACTELVVAGYRSAFFTSARGRQVNVATARAGNVIGGGDWSADRLIPDVIRAWQSGQSVRIRNPDAIRPWQHVLEPLHGYLILAERLHAGGAGYAGAWNFGPHATDARPVRWIVERLSTLYPNGRGWEQDGGEHPHEAHYLKLDCSKAMERLGWMPRWSLPTALERVAEWYGAFENGTDVAQLCARQMDEYMGDVT